MTAPASHVLGAHVTPFGKLEGSSTVSLMTEAAQGALDAAGLQRSDIDGLICGYSTALPHLMLATVFSEHFGLRPNYAHAIQMGGGTGAGMLMLGDALIRAGEAHTILVVSGENRLTGMSRDAAVQTLAQVGHPKAESPLGATIPAYYALTAARYLHETGASQADLAELAVLMRRLASDTPGAQLTAPIAVEDVLGSKTIADPLKLMDCCPISDGGAEQCDACAEFGHLHHLPGGQVRRRRRRPVLHAVPRTRKGAAPRPATVAPRPATAAASHA